MAAKLQAASSLAQAWRQAVAEGGDLVRREILPLEQARAQRLKELVLLLDQGSRETALGDEEREELSAYLADSAGELLEEVDDDELELVFQRHSGIDDTEAESLAQAGFKEILNEVYDVEIDEDLDLRSPEGMAVVESLLEEEVDAAQARQAWERVAAEQADAIVARHTAQLHNAVDGLLRELADAFDAGKPLDADARKASLECVHRAEAAAAARDLPQLLALRFELEQRGMVDHLSEKQIAEYNKLLKEELRLLALENARHLKRAAGDLPGVPVAQLTPAFLLDEIKRDISEMRREVAELEQELVVLKGQGGLRAWLRKPGERDDLDG